MFTFESKIFKKYLLCINTFCTHCSVYIYYLIYYANITMCFLWNCRGLYDVTFICLLKWDREEIFKVNQCVLISRQKCLLNETSNVPRKMLNIYWERKKKRKKRKKRDRERERERERGGGVVSAFGIAILTARGIVCF